ncbi:MAG: gliding motility-associated C-terminal domain-containing protein [Mucilaginibacter sp.]
MKLIFKIGFGFLLFIATASFAQLPPNIGFEKGNFDGWECSVGKRSPAGDVMYPGGGPTYNRHTLIDTNSRNQLDKYGHFPVLCPNGSNYSIKLGNDLAGGQMQRVSYTFIVPANVDTYSIVFNYAVVLEDGGHPKSIQPLFTAKVFDVTDNTEVSCPSFDFSASSTLPGFKLSDIRKPPMPTPNGGFTVPGPIYYKDWSTAMIDLKSYAGKKIRLEFTAEDCQQTVHSGYAYLDIDEQLSLKPISGNIFCSNQTQTTLNGPTGFADYIWYKNGDLNQPGVHGQSITIPAVDQQKYTLEVIPYPELGCIDYLYITLEKLAEPFNLVVAKQVLGCPGTGVNLKASSVTAGSSSNMQYTYYTDPAGLVYLPNPDAVLKSGTYYIRGTNAGGCTDIQPVEVVISSPDITVVDPSRVQYPTMVDLSTTFTHVTGNTYSYFKDAAATVAMDQNINVTGTYYIKATSGTPCSVVVPVKVVVDPPPPYTITAPNAFTPNGDGINDNFSIKLDGYITLSSLNIFNRYGQRVFTTRSATNYWNGNMGSQQLPSGTYYWIFEGTDDYYHTKVTKASSITIIR